MENPNVDLFEVATREKYRFPFRGMVSTEDLFDLGIKELDSIFKVLNSQLKQTKEESLLNTKTQADTELENKINIIKYIVQVKQQEELAKLQAKENKQKKQRILELMAKKDNESMESMSKEELQKMLEELN